MCFVAQIGHASNVRRPAPNCGVSRPALKSQEIRAEQHIVHIQHLDESPVAPEELSMKPRPATLVLGGGGARGVAHLGAIQELLSAGVAAERIVGVSSGSIAGAMFAFEPDISVVVRRTIGFLRSPEFCRHQRLLLAAHPRPGSQPAAGLRARYNRLTELVQANRMFFRAVRHSSLLPGEILDRVVDYLLPDVQIEDARIPLSIVAVDLNSGRPVVFEKGPLRLAARASASVPGIFPPVPLDGRLVCDIGGFCALPLGIARSYGPRYLIAVDVGSNLRPLSSTPTALEVLMRMNDIGAGMFREQLRAEADLTIVPDVADVPWFDFTTTEAMIEAGRAATRTALARLPAPQSWFQRLLGDSLSRAAWQNGNGAHPTRGAADFHL
jgi:NTE family protein